MSKRKSAKVQLVVAAAALRPMVRDDYAWGVEVSTRASEHAEGFIGLVRPVPAERGDGA